MIKPRMRKRDGKRVYDVRLRDPGGKEYWRTFETKKDAERYETGQKNARNVGSWIDPRLASTPYRVLADEWLESNPAKRPSSLTRDRAVLRKHVLPVLGDRAVASIKRADIQWLVRSWTERYAPATVDRIFSPVNAGFNYAVLGDMIVKNPCRGVKLPEVSPRDAEILETDDLERLADAMGPCGPMVYLAAMGLRWGEIAGLRVGKIDFLRHILTIDVQRTGGGPKSRMVEHAPKTRAGRRSFSVPDWVTKMLADHLAARGLTGADGDEHVFATVKGNPLTYSNWYGDVWVPARTAAGFFDLRFHDLRHTAATALVAEGVDLKTAQVRLGHIDPRTTLQVYVQATQKADRAAAEKVGSGSGREMLARSKPDFSAESPGQSGQMSAS